MQYQKDNKTSVKVGQNPGGNSTFQLNWDEGQKDQKPSVKVTNKQLHSQIQFGYEENSNKEGKNPTTNPLILKNKKQENLNNNINQNHLIDNEANAVQYQQQIKLANNIKNAQQSHFQLGDYDSSNDQKALASKKQVMNKQQENNIFNNQQQAQQSQQHTQVKVNQAPGGKSNIILG